MKTARIKIFLNEFFPYNLNHLSLNNLTYNLVLLWAILAGYFAFTDLQISISIVNQNLGWAIFLRKYGEIPGLIVLYLGAVIFIASYKSDNKLKYYAFFTFVFLTAVYLLKRTLSTVYIGLTDNSEFITNNKFYIYTFFFITNIIIYMLFKRIRYSEEFKNFSVVSVLLGLYGYLLLVQPIKNLWGRIRFRDLDALYSNFTPWFLPNGLNGNQSFPSGHAAMAWMILPLLILVANKGKVIRNALLVIIIIWGLVVPLSRVVIGAHYASDALFGACIIILFYLIINIKHQYTFISDSK